MKPKQYILNLICNTIGHNPYTIKEWVDHDVGFVRATEQCKRCKYSYNWEPFYGDPKDGIIKHYTHIGESGEYLP